MSKTIVNNTGWIIKNAKKNKIWKQIYFSREEAMTELNNQVHMIQRTRPTYTGSDWKIESFNYDTKIDSKEEKDFEGF